MCYSLGSLDFGAGGLEHAHARAVSIHLDANTISLAGSGVEDGHVGLVDRHGLFHDATFGTLHGVGLDVLLHQVDALHHEAGLILAGGHDATLAFVTAGQHDNFVASANLVHGASFRELQVPETRSS